MVKPFRLVGEMDTVGIRLSVMVHSDDSNTNTNDTLATFTRKEEDDEEEEEKRKSFIFVGWLVGLGEKMGRERGKGRER